MTVGQVNDASARNQKILSAARIRVEMTSAARDHVEETRQLSELDSCDGFLARSGKQPAKKTTIEFGLTLVELGAIDT